MYQMEQSLLKQPFGVNKSGNQVLFSFVSDKQDCGIVLYDINTGTEKARYPFQNQFGNVFYLALDEKDVESVAYSFYEEGRIVADKYAVGFAEKDTFGEYKNEESFKALLENDEYDWEDDSFPGLTYEESIV